MYDFSKHIQTLANNGVQLITDQGCIDLTVDFYRQAVRRMQADKKWLASFYDIAIPGVQGDFTLAIHRDGRVSSGSTKTVMELNDR